MHDLKFAGEIITVLRKNLVLSNAKAPPRSVVVNVRLSPFSHVTPEGLKETFRQLGEGEGLADVRLNIMPLDFEIHCRSCKRISRSAKAVFNCPQCGGGDFDIMKEKEFIVDSIEVET